MNNNQRANKIAIEKFRKELIGMLGDVQQIDAKVLNKAVNIGLADVKQNTPVDSGYMEENWYTSPTKKTKKGSEKGLFNIADYASYVNYGHRVVVKSTTVGFIKGRFMLEKAMAKVDKVIEIEFKKEVERVNRKHDR